MQTNSNKEKIHKATTQLSIIYGYLQLLEKELAKNGESKELKWILKALQSCKELELLLVEVDVK